MPYHAAAPRHRPGRDCYCAPLHPGCEVDDRADDCARWRPASRLGTTTASNGGMMCTVFVLPPRDDRLSQLSHGSVTTLGSTSRSCSQPPRHRCDTMKITSL